MIYTFFIQFSFQENNLGILKILVNAGADVDYRHSESKFTILMMAADTNRVEIVKYLIDIGANLTLEDKNGDSAIDMAENLEIIKMLSLAKQKEERQ